MTTLEALRQRDLNLLILRDHLVLEGPSSATAQLGDNDITFAHHVDVKVNVGDWSHRDVHLRDMGRKVGHDL